MDAWIETLKYARMLANKGWEMSKAEPFMEMLADMDIRNLYNKDEINTMLPEAIEKAFEQERRQADQRFALMKERFDSEIATHLAESRSARRWLAGIVITGMLALAGYLSALLHMAH